MSVTREMVKGVAAMQKFAGATEHRLPLTTPDAIALSKLLADAELRHPEQVRKSAAEIDVLNGSEALEAVGGASVDTKIAYYKAYDEAAKVFWDAFNQQEVEGVEIIRRA